MDKSTVLCRLPNTASLGSLGLDSMILWKRKKHFEFCFIFWNDPDCSEGERYGDSSVHLFSVKVWRLRSWDVRQDGDCDSRIMGGVRHVLIIDSEQFHDFEPKSHSGSDLCRSWDDLGWPKA